MHRLLTRLLLIALAASAAGPTFAQPAEEAPAEESKTDGTAESAQDTAATGKPSSEVFIPTEEISEDFAVSFPVDI